MTLPEMFNLALKRKRHAFKVIKHSRFNRHQKDHIHGNLLCLKSEGQSLLRQDKDCPSAATSDICMFPRRQTNNNSVSSCSKV